MSTLESAIGQGETMLNFQLNEQQQMIRDMIRDFARKQAGNGARIRLDTWPHMNHDFQAHGRTLPASGEAIDRICAAIDWATAGAEFAPAAVTEVDHM